MKKLLYSLFISCLMFGFFSVASAELGWESQKNTGDEKFTRPTGYSQKAEVNKYIGRQDIKIPGAMKYKELKDYDKKTSYKKYTKNSGVDKKKPSKVEHGNSKDYFIKYGSNRKVPIKKSHKSYVKVNKYRELNEYGNKNWHKKWKEKKPPNHKPRFCRPWFEGYCKNVCGDVSPHVASGSKNWGRRCTPVRYRRCLRCGFLD